MSRLTLCAAASWLALASPAAGRAGDAEDGKRVHEAVLRLRDEVFNHCVMEAELSAPIESNGALTARRSGTVVFARSGLSVFSDAAIVYTNLRPRDDGGKWPDSHTYIQFFLAPGRRCFGINYKPTEGGKNLATVSHDPRRTYDDNLRALTGYVYVDQVLTPFAGTGKTLAALTEPRPASVRKTAAGLTAVYSTEFGSVEVGIDRVGGQDVVVSARLSQTAIDVYTSLSEGKTLADVRLSILGETPRGLTSTVVGFEVVYKDAPDGCPFASYKQHAVYAAAGKEWRVEHTLRLTKYRPCTKESEIESLGLPIPEGQRVYSLDPEYHDTLLAYRMGDVVRKIDGVPLEQIFAETRRKRIMLSVTVGRAGALFVLGAGFSVHPVAP